MAKDLTDLAIKALKPGSARREVPDGHTRGLFFVIQPSGAASWAVRYRFAGKPTKFTIGPYPAYDLKTARQLASKAMLDVARGIDPAATKRDAKAAAKEQPADDYDLVENVVKAFIDRYAKKNHKNWRETERVLNNELVWGWKGRRIGEIKRAHIHDILDRMIDRGAPVQANRALTTMRKFFNWAVEREIIEASPCSRVKPPTPTTSRDRVLSDDEIKASWEAFGTAGRPFGDLAKLLLLTGQRRGEAAKMKWTDVDLNKAIWNIPKANAKNGVFHQVPLSAPAIDLLKKMPKIKVDDTDSPFVFTTTGKTPVSGFSKAKKRFDSALKAATKAADAPNENLDEVDEADGWVLHDMRRTCASGMAKLGVAPHIVEAVLNHKSGQIKGVAAVYNRFKYDPEKRAALEAWGRYVDAIVTSETVSNVFRLSNVRA